LSSSSPYASPRQNIPDILLSTKRKVGISPHLLSHSP
jgi:hypothetical protein